MNDDWHFGVEEFFLPKFQSGPFLLKIISGFFHSTLALHNNSTLQSVSPGFFQPLNLPYFGVGSSSFTKMLPYSLK